MDLQKLEQEMKAHNISSISVAVICDSNQEIFRQLQPDSNEEPSNRGFDLLIRKKSSNNEKQYVFKYWIISRELCLNYIYDGKLNFILVYLQQAIKIFAVGMPHSTEQLVTLKDKYDISYIELKNMKNIFEKF